MFRNLNGQRSNEKLRPPCILFFLHKGLLYQLLLVQFYHFIFFISKSLYINTISSAYAKRLIDILCNSAPFMVSGDISIILTSYSRTRLEIIKEGASLCLVFTGTFLFFQTLYLTIVFYALTFISLISFCGTWNCKIYIFY